MSGTKPATAWLQFPVSRATKAYRSKTLGVNAQVWTKVAILRNNPKRKKNKLYLSYLDVIIRIEHKKS